MLKSIGAIRDKPKLLELVQKLSKYTDRDDVWHPCKGQFDVFSKTDIYQTLKILGKSEVVVVNEHYEHYEPRKFLDLGELSEHEFVEKVSNKDYFIYSADREILFSVDWDSFFFLIATSQKNISCIECVFERFWMDSQMTHTWEF